MKKMTEKNRIKEAIIKEKEKYRERKTVNKIS